MNFSSRVPAKPQDTVQEITKVTRDLAGFWRKAKGWAPADAAALLSAARLDRQASLSLTLDDYLESFAPEEVEGRLILGYATLRSLCEGALKLFFAVWLNDYRRDAKAIRDAKGNVKLPPDISFDRLIALYGEKVERKYEEFLRRVQHRGNGIHSFADRTMGNQSELIADIVRFLAFLLSINGKLPYPDFLYDPGWDNDYSNE